VMLEIFNNLFMSVAEQMGVRLQSTAHSVNIKERLDFSCAVFDADGGLIAVIAFDLLDGQVQAIRTVANPEKLRHIGPVSRAWHLRWRESDEED